MNRKLPATVLFLAIGGSAHAQVRDTPPTAPGSPVARAYGPTSGGIAWQRSTDDRGVRGYEITRDGTVLGVRDTLSYVADDLQPGRGYNFAIVAIDSAGQRSGRALARIETPDARPNTPTGLVANVYSATSAGIKWDRSGVPGERYQVKRDGEVVVETTNGTSYIDRSLSNRRPYLFEVIAINRQGQRSAAARLFVRTTDGPPPTEGPAVPSGLRSVVYSGTAGAIAWERAATPGLRYEISRDGDVLATTDGTSYVDSDLAPGLTYAFAVVAIDREGGRSAASRVTLTTPGRPSAPPPPDNPFAEPDPSGTTTVARLGYPGARDVAAELVSAAYLSLYLEIDAVVSTLVTSDDGVEQTVSCPDGGTARGTSQPGPVKVVLEFEACAIEDRTLTGRLERVENRFPSGAGSVREVAITFDALNIDAGEGGLLTVTGTYERSEIQGQNDRCDAFGKASDAIAIESASLVRDGDTSSIADASYTQSTSRQDRPEGGIDDAPCVTSRALDFEGEASVVSSRFGAEAATFATGGEVSGDTLGESSRTAALDADFGDGSALVVTATSPTDDEVQVDILSDGAAVSFTDEYAFEARDYGIALY